MEIQIEKMHFHHIFTESKGSFKNKWMLNNVFDVLYLNLYGYLHYSYFPHFGTNPIDMEMGSSASWQSWGQKEREREFPGLLLLKICWKHIFRILWLRVIGYKGLHKPLRAQQRAESSIQENMVIGTNKTQRIIRNDG